MWRLICPGCQSLKQGWPLGAVRVADVNYVQLALALKGLHDCAVASDVAEGGPGAHLLELQHHLPGGLEGAGLVRRGQPGAVAPLARVGHATKQGLEEVVGQLLFDVAVRGAELIEHPHELLDTGAVLVSDGSGGLEEDVGGPLAREVKVEVAGGRDGYISGVICMGGSGSMSTTSGGGRGGSGGGGVIRIAVVLGRRRGEVFFIHEDVEAFFVCFWLVIVEMVLSGGSGAT